MIDIQLLGQITCLCIIVASAIVSIDKTIIIYTNINKIINKQKRKSWKKTKKVKLPN